MNPHEIVTRLREIAAYLDLGGERFRARAYRRAAVTLEACPDPGLVIEQGRLSELPGIGAPLAGVIGELSRRGTVGVLERLRERWPKTVLELAQLSGVGTVKARRLHEALGPRTLDELADLCERGSVRALPGFGKVSEARLLAAIQGRHVREKKVLLPEARELGHTLSQSLSGLATALRVETCGPARRWLEVVDHMALAVATDAPETVRDALRSHPMVVSLTPRSARVASAQLASGLACELHTVRLERFGGAMIDATGAPEHVEALHALAVRRGLLFEEIAGSEESAVYTALGLSWLPPELRDGTDELDAAMAGERFDLVTLEDVTGAVHCHTTHSDGRHTIEQMAAAARARGLSFLTVTDHSASASYAGGLDAEKLVAQGREIAEAEERAGIRILRGTECDILADGSLDYPLELLRELDVVIASVHRRHRLDEEDTTRRLVRALRQPVFKIWGHPLGRLLLRRDPLACRFDEVLDAILESQVAIELNGDPHRLDLDPERARSAAARGARFVLSVDAHSIGQLDNLVYAVAIARRARLRKRDVLNTLSPREFAEAVRPRDR